MNRFARIMFVLAVLATQSFAGVRVEEIRTPAAPTGTPPAAPVPPTFKVTIFGEPERLAKTVDGTPTGAATRAFETLEEATLDPGTILPVGQEIPVGLLQQIPAPLPNRQLQVQTTLTGSVKFPTGMKFEPDTTFVAGATFILGFNPITAKSFVPQPHLLVTGTRLSGYATKINEEQGLVETVATARRLQAVEARPTITAEEFQQMKNDLKELKDARTGVLAARDSANQAASDAKNAVQDAKAAANAATKAAGRANSAAEKAEKLIQKFTVEYEYATDCKTYRPIRRKVGTNDWELAN